MYPEGFIKALQKHNLELVEILKYVEWNGKNQYGNPACPWCGDEKPIHDKNCELKRELDYNE